MSGDYRDDYDHLLAKFLLLFFFRIVVVLVFGAVAACPECDIIIRGVSRRVI